MLKCGRSMACKPLLDGVLVRIAPQAHLNARRHASARRGLPNLYELLARFPIRRNGVKHLPTRTSELLTWLCSHTVLDAMKLCFLDETSFSSLGPRV
eukprot:1533366-Pleurochrysis_carterae.AAC.2